MFNSILSRVVIQELIKTVASSQQLNREGQKEFKVRLFFLSSFYISFKNVHKLKATLPRWWCLPRWTS